jgi:hypothetical protein
MFIAAHLLGKFFRTASLITVVLPAAAVEEWVNSAIVAAGMPKNLKIRTNEVSGLF